MKIILSQQFYIMKVYKKNNSQIIRGRNNRKATRAHCDKILAHEFKSNKYMQPQDHLIDVQSIPISNRDYDQLSTFREIEEFKKLRHLNGNI